MSVGHVAVGHTARQACVLSAAAVTTTTVELALFGPGFGQSQVYYVCIVLEQGSRLDASLARAAKGRQCAGNEAH